jgi:hypothetical protein
VTNVALAETDRRPLPALAAVRAVSRCVLTSIAMLSAHRIRQPSEHVGDPLHFADGSSARVYRESVVPGVEVGEPAALVVEFRLRWVRGKGHALFRAESLLNTPLFVGFPGFVSKLWLTHDQEGLYRGVYQWNGPELAHAYARGLWWILALVCERDSIHYAVLPGVTRDELVAGTVAGDREWWRITGGVGAGVARASSCQNDV